MKYVYWRRARQIVQILSLLAFFALVVYTFRDVQRPVNAQGLMRLDPLAALVTSLSTRRWIAAFIPALLLTMATLILGRFWCGWLCPLGTILDVVPAPSEGAGDARSGWRGVKYGLLFLILFAAFWRNTTLLILDPLAIFVRSVTALVIPGLNWLIVQLEGTLYKAGILRGVVDAVDAALQGTIISYRQPYYQGVLPLSLLLGGILALNLFKKRVWCRYLCPLGGLLSLLSRASWLKRRAAPSCVECSACEKVCPMGTIDGDEMYASDSGECILCMDCAADCPQGAIRFEGDVSIAWDKGYEPTRRQLLTALGASVGGLALLRVTPSTHHPDPRRLRPPGVKEEELLATCIRCGACMRACPSHGLQPSWTESGIEGLWTPILVPRLGHCDYSCTACGDTCPTGAIPSLSLEEKRETPIGKAYIDPELCIAWSGRSPCIVCEEMCPLPGKAIILEEKEVQDDRGGTRTLQVPVVQHERCIGCGTCENKCPVNGEAAIRVIVDPL
ncbi:MAG: 4Fe-4S dicluster domain-containing protein [Anaerolineae bacterium]